MKHCNYCSTNKIIFNLEFIVCQITDTYTCVPASLCPGNGNGTIDPRALPNVRIVAPTSATTTTTVSTNKSAHL